MLFPIIPSPDDLAAHEREEARWHPEKEALELAAAGAARVLGPGHSVTKAFAKAAGRDQKAELAGIVEVGPDREETGLVRWRRVDLKVVIEERFGVVYNERSVSRLLHELGFAHISARPYHPAQKATVLEDFKKTSRAR